MVFHGHLAIIFAWEVAEWCLFSCSNWLYMHFTYVFSEMFSFDDWTSSCGLKPATADVLNRENLNTQ